MKLDFAFRQTKGKRLFLCPLDVAGQIPTLQFGPNAIRTYGAGELNDLVDAQRLAGFNPDRTFDSKRFSQFNWLVIEEPFLLPTRASHRSDSILDQLVFDGDWGRIRPHPERFERPVEAALFAVLLAPWEDWVDSPEFYWLGFQVPWAYATDDNLFDRPSPPPLPDSLSWEPDVLFDNDGEVVYEVEKPATSTFDTSIAEAPRWLNDDRWTLVERAKTKTLFETPIAHFFVRAFCSEGRIDEFLAHITTIEAALGLKSDYEKRGATKRLAKRVTGLLGASADGDSYEHLFNLRSEYLHGRAMDDISGDDRLIARKLARRVVNGIVDAADRLPPSQSREDYLMGLA